MTADQPDFLEDRVLSTTAEVVHDLEAMRVAAENRYRSMTDPKRIGLSKHHPAAVELLDFIEEITAAEKKRIKKLERVMAKHPLWTQWGASIPGVGEKTLARLLGVIGDPYWNNGEYKVDGVKYRRSRPRTRGELAAYCGMQVVDGRAPDWITAQKGIKWDREARKRLWVIAEKTIWYTGASYEVTKGKQAGMTVTRQRSPYRDLYDEVRAKEEGMLHVHPCAQCGTKAEKVKGVKGVPAPVGWPMRDSHLKARGIRKVARQILDDLWDVAEKLHAERGAL